MSKLWKGVKKVFKKVTKFVKKHWKTIVIAAAVYFTAGIALGAMPATASFSAAMPGFGAGEIFANAAVSLGFTGAAGSGIAGTVAANAAAAAGTAGSVVAGSGGLINLPATGAVANAATGSQIAATAASTGGTIAAGAKTAGVVGKTLAGMSGLEKVALAGTVFKGISGLLSDDQDTINRKQHARENAQAYGIGRKGEGEGWGGLVDQSFGDMFGGQGSEQMTSAASAPEAENVSEAKVAKQKMAAPSPNYEGDSPFKDMGTSEQASAPDQNFFSQGYQNKSYSPV